MHIFIPDILALILSRVCTKRRDASECRRVCKLWKEEADRHFWRCLEFKDSQSLDNLPLLFHQDFDAFNCIHQFHLLPWRLRLETLERLSNWLNVFFAHAKALRVLELSSNILDSIPVGSWQVLYSSCKDIQAIYPYLPRNLFISVKNEINEGDGLTEGEKLAQLLPHLAQVDARRGPLSAAGYSSWIPTNIRRLEISYKTAIEVDLWAGAMPRLEDLSVYFPKVNLPDTFEPPNIVPDVPRPMPNLESISMHDFHGLDDLEHTKLITMESILTHTPNLKMITLVASNHQETLFLSANILTILAKYTPSLSTLKAKLASDFADADWAAFDGIMNLTILHLLNLSDLNTRNFQAPNVWKKLQKFAPLCSRTNSMTAETLERMISSMEDIRELDLQGVEALVRTHTVRILRAALIAGKSLRIISGRKSSGGKLGGAKSEYFEWENLLNDLGHPTENDSTPCCEIVGFIDGQLLEWLKPVAKKNGFLLL